MNILRPLSILLLTSFIAANGVWAGEIEVDVPARIDIQGTKVLWNNLDDEDGNNIENWFGRAVFGITSKGDNFRGKILVHAYPADFGWTQVLNVTAEDTIHKTDLHGHPYDSIVAPSVKSQKVDKFLLYNAYAEFENKIFDIKLGRYNSNDRVGKFFGNYADEGPGGKFLATGVLVNAMELSQTYMDHLFFRLAFEGHDDHLNEGQLRAAVRYDGLPLNMNFAVHYRNNIFDYIHDPDTTLHHNVSSTLEVPLMKAWRFFGEVGFINITSDNTPDIPVTGGVEYKGRALDRIVLEAEWFKDREEDDSGCQKKVLGSFYVEKSVGERFKILFGIHSWEQTSDLAMSARLTATIN